MFIPLIHSFQNREIIQSRKPEQADLAEQQIQGVRPDELERQQSVFGGDARAFSYQEKPKKEVSFWKRLI